MTTPRVREGIDSSPARAFAWRDDAVRAIERAPTYAEGHRLARTFLLQSHAVRGMVACGAGRKRAIPPLDPLD